MGPFRKTREMRKKGSYNNKYFTIHFIKNRGNLVDGIDAQAETYSRIRFWFLTFTFATRMRKSTDPYKNYIDDAMVTSYLLMSVPTD